jgi:glutamate synthase domain-containing protein 3
MGSSAVEGTYVITTADRAIPATLSGRLAGQVAMQREPRRGSPIHPLQDRAVRLTFTGSAGQGFGAFLEPGIHLLLEGEANDGVCKSMSGGTVCIRPARAAAFRPEESAIIGNCALYGATGGELFVHGLAGDRFAVRNSGATAVVEGVGLHACEYMTGGRVLIIGQVSHNVGAGMTGGVLYMRRENASHINTSYVAPQELNEEEAEDILHLLRRHNEYLDSAAVRQMIENWHVERAAFLRCVPLAAMTLHAGKLQKSRV